jgi:hypothetical protein
LFGAILVLDAKIPNTSYYNSIIPMSGFAPRHAFFLYGSTGPSFDVDASCDGGRDLNLADVLGGGLMSMYGYDCVNEEPQNCLVDVTWDIEVGSW